MTVIDICANIARQTGRSGRLSFDDVTLVVKVRGKIFALLATDQNPDTPSII